MKTQILLIISGVMIFSLVSCSKKANLSNLDNKPVCVKVAKLNETNANVPIQSSGILSSKRIIKLSFKTGGIISRIKVNEGSNVKKGQLLAALDLTEISAQVEQAKLGFDKAKRDLDRVKNLYNDTVATLEQLQNATSAYEIALENKNIAEFNQQFSAITAPADGKIIAKLFEEHELVGPGSPILVFAEQGNDDWVVNTGVSDKDIVRIKKGDKATAEIDAFPGVIFPAYVSKIAETADPTSGTFEIELTVSNGNVKLINGLVAKIKIVSTNTNTVTLVPPEALTEADGRKGYVYVVEKEDSVAKKIPVTIAYLANSNIAVLEPVNKLGQVVVKGASYLEDGIKVTIIR